MLSLPVTYVSRRGPNVPAEPDVRFLRTCLDYGTALRCLGELQNLHPNHELVLYRVGRDPEKQSEFWLERLRPVAANAYPPEPVGSNPFSYVIYAAPQPLCNDDDELFNEVDVIWKGFGQGDPVNAGPHAGQPPKPPTQ
jgi:hypothetical protein